MTYEFIGWCHDPENNHDKIWGVYQFDDNKYVTYHGRRGKKLQSKTFSKACSVKYDVLSLVSSKRRKGYREISINECPEGFEEELDKIRFWAKMSL